MTDNDCPHGEHPSWCVDCLEGKPAERPRPQWAKVGDEFVARYDGTCGDCCRPIVSGMTRVQRWDRGAGLQLATVYRCAGACRP